MKRDRAMATEPDNRRRKRRNWLWTTCCVTVVHSLPMVPPSNPKSAASRTSASAPTAEDIIQARILLKAQTIRDPLSRSDAIVVLCSYDTRVAEYAAELHREQWAPLVLFSGKEGANTQGRFSASEAEIFADIARRCGVPSKAILLEKEARNTGENVRLSRELLDARGIQVKSVIAVQKPFMGLRVRATFQKVWPEVKVLVTSPPQELEELAPAGMGLSEIISIVVGDFERVLEYPKLGYQTEQPVSDQARAAFAHLKRRGYTARLIRSARPTV